MKLKETFKPTFPKAILFAVSLCAFLMLRYGAFTNSHSARVARIIPSAKAAAHKEVPSLQTPPVAQETKSASIIVPKTAPLQIVPKKRFTLQRIKRSRVAKRQIARKAFVTSPALAQILKLEEKTFESNTEALNIQGPLEDFVTLGMSEDSQPTEQPYNANYFAENIQTLEVLVAEESIPVEPELLVQEPIVKKNSFTEIRASLEQMKAQEVAVIPAPAKPEPTLVRRNLVLSKPLKVASSNPSPEHSTPATETLAPSTVTEPDVRRESEDDSEEEEPTFVQPKKQSPNLSPMQASVAPELSNSFSQIGSSIAKSIQKTTTSLPPSVTTQNPEVQTVSVDTQKHSQVVNQEPPIHPSGDILIGNLFADTRADQWMTENRGSVELSLHKYDSYTNPDDWIQIPYDSRDKSFTYDSSQLVDRYELVARVFTGKAAAPAATVIYPTILGPENFRQKVSFHLKGEDFVRNRNSDTPGKLTLNLTVFEGATGNYRHPKAIESADVTLVGLESYGHFKSDKDGNVRIENVPAHSQLLVDVSANGYYPTRKIVPTTDTHAYGTVQMIERQKVDTITRYFTKKPQSENRALMFGRVYHPNTGRPVQDDEVFLSGRKGHALYFSALPDTSLTRSTSTGLFSFLNVEPVFRAVSRAHSNHAFPTQFLPGYAYYTEFGRGGKKAFKAVVTDPVQKNKVVHGFASTIGSVKGQFGSDEKGAFTIENVDLPTGNITVEFRAKDYPVTWYTLPWSSRDAEKTYQLYTLEKELIYESAVTFARLKPAKHKGILVGGVAASVFKKAKSCIRAELLDIHGKPLAEEKGPYLLYERSNPTEVCLTKNSSGFAFYNLDPGEYVLNWKDAAGTVLSTQVVRAGADRLSIVVR